MEEIEKRIISETYKIHYVSIRVHKQFVDEDELIKYIHQYHKPFMVLETCKDAKTFDGRHCVRDHYQTLFIKKSPKGSTPKTIRDNIGKDVKKKLTLKGNAEFAVSYIYETPDKFLRYLCKGSKDKLPDIKINNILLENQVAPYHNKYWEENKNYKSTDAHRKYGKIMAIKLPENYQKYENTSTGIGMKIIIYHDLNNLLIPDDFQLKKMIRTYHFKTIETDTLKWNRALHIVEQL